MKAVFISDAHLKSERDRGYQYLLAFMEDLKGRIDDLFVVGDFFDFWFCGNGRVYPPFQPVIDGLLGLKESGVRVHLFEGNHDFSLGSYFTEKGVEVFADWADLTLDGQRFLISHGDTVDTSNIRYLALRAVLRTAAFCRVQKWVPAAVLWKIADASSRASKGLTLESQDILAGIMKSFSLKKFAEGFDAVILGHCHRPILHQVEIGGRRKTFATLGDWIEHYSYLIFEDGNFTLSFFQPGKDVFPQ